MVVNKNIDINIDSYPISMAISIVPNIVEIDIEIEILLTPGGQDGDGLPKKSRYFSLPDRFFISDNVSVLTFFK